MKSFTRSILLALLAIAASAQTFEAFGIDSVSVSPSSIDLGQSVTITANGSIGGQNPSGDINFRITRPDGSVSNQRIAFIGGPPSSQSIVFTPTMGGTYSVESNVVGIYWNQYPPPPWPAPQAPSNYPGTWSPPTTFVVFANTVPTISNITNKTIPEDGSTGAIGFTIGDGETVASSLTVTRSSSNTTLVPVGNIALGGSGASRTVSATPAANLSGTTTITVTVSDGELSVSDSFTLTVTPVNDTPTISNISNRTIPEDSSTGSIAFTVGDVETAASSLSVTRSSSNTTLVPVGNIALGGSGANRTVSVTPAANQYGSTTITITVSDGLRSASDSFTVIVFGENDPPSIPPIPPRSIPEDSSTGAIAFTVSDLETAASTLSVTRSSSNTTLVPLGNVLLGGSGTNRTVSITPAANKNGTTTITITASDGEASATRSFVLTVTPVNDAPTISSVAPITIPEDSSTGAIAFTIGDGETAASSLDVSGTSQNTTLVPTGGIALGGSGASRTIQVTPAAGLSGTATISIVVSDGDKTATSNFLLTVNSVNDPPTITPIANQTIAEDSSTGAIAFSIADPDTPLNELVLTRSSSNTALIPLLTGVALSGTGANRTVTVTPAANQYGSSNIVITLSDGSATVGEAFTVTVNSVNDAPEITNLANRILEINSSSGALPFSISDIETAATELVVTATSNNAALYPAANIVLSGSGANRSVTLVPVANQTGTALVTLTVTDANGGTDADSFNVQVTADTDGDGIPDAVERAIGSNPNAATSTGSTPQFSIESPVQE